jgi:nucleotide-binding universal stress UspA family protein
MYKTIVVHVGTATGAHITSDVAIHLANRNGAHLVGTAASGFAELSYLIAIGAPVAMMPTVDLEALRAESRRRLRSFEVRCRELGVESFESRAVDTSAAETLLLQSRYCDLVVADTEDMTDYGLLAPARLPATLVTRCVRPVLLVPPQAAPDAPMRTVMVAWNGSPGASRALAFALPILRNAVKVYVAVCNPELVRVDVGAEPGADLAAYLARHHRDVEVLQTDSNDETGSALCDLARKRGADLMVAGAYGHSRFHDWVLGSTTRSLIEQTAIPLLMTH